LTKIIILLLLLWIDREFPNHVCAIRSLEFDYTCYSYLCPTVELNRMPVAAAAYRSIDRRFPCLRLLAVGLVGDYLGPSVRCDRRESL